jgi:hypothetical protein
MVPLVLVVVSSLDSVVVYDVVPLVVLVTYVVVGLAVVNVVEPEVEVKIDVPLIVVVFAVV